MKTSRALLALLLASCSAASGELRVEVSTDLVAGVDFDAITLRADDADLARREVSRNEIGQRALEAPVRVDAPIADGRYLVEVALTRGGAEVLSQRAQVVVSGRTGVQFVLTQSCVGLSCGGSSSNCLGAICVPDGCTTGVEDACEDVFAGCTRDAECPASPTACLAPTCLPGGACALAPLTGACGADEYCDLGRGCLPIPMSLDGGPPDAGPSWTPMSVVPTFPNNPDFGSRILRGEAPNHETADVACTGDEAGHETTCLDGGEMRTATLSGETTCGGLTIRDDLDAFDWYCIETSAGLRFQTWGLRPQTRLADLIAEGSFIPNALSVSRGDEIIARSEPAVWWSNPIQPLADSPALPTELDVPGTIYWAGADVMTGGFRITGDRVMLVIAPAARALLQLADTPDCVLEPVVPGKDDGFCGVLATDRRFIWIEGRFVHSESPPTGLQGIAIGRSRFVRIRHVEVTNVRDRALLLGQLETSLLQDVDQQRAGRGLDLIGPRFVRVVRARFAFNTDDARLNRWQAGGRRNSYHNVFTDLVLTGTGNGRGSLTLDCGNSNETLTRVISGGNARAGFVSICSGHITMSHFTTLNNGGNGFEINQNQSNTFNQVLAINNASAGIAFVDGPNGVDGSQAASLGNGGAGLRSDAHGNARIDGILMLGGNARQCQVTRASPFVDTTCTVTGEDGSSDYGAGSSTAIFRPGRDPAGALLGRVREDDLDNPRDTDGLGDPGFQFWRLSSRYRFWGLEGGDIPASDARGRCTGTGCRIWDVRLPSSSPVFERSADGATPNPAFVPGTPCPANANGNITLSDGIRLETLRDGVGNDDGICDAGEDCGPGNTFLVNAWEIIEDHVGDDDGLCESNERCRYSPHIGAWQGDTPDEQLVDTCVFDDAGGPVTGVTMYGEMSGA